MGFSRVDLMKQKGISNGEIDKLFNYSITNGLSKDQTKELMDRAIAEKNKEDIEKYEKKRQWGGGVTSALDSFSFGLATPLMAKALSKISGTEYNDELDDFKHAQAIYKKRHPIMGFATDFIPDTALAFATGGTAPLIKQGGKAILKQGVKNVAKGTAGSAVRSLAEYREGDSVEETTNRVLKDTKNGLKWALALSGVGTAFNLAKNGLKKYGGKAGRAVRAADDALENISNSDNNIKLEKVGKESKDKAKQLLDVLNYKKQEAYKEADDLILKTGGANPEKVKRNITDYMNKVADEDEKVIFKKALKEIDKGINSTERFRKAKNYINDSVRTPASRKGKFVEDLLDSYSGEAKEKIKKADNLYYNYNRTNHPYSVSQRVLNNDSNTQAGKELLSSTLKGNGGFEFLQTHQNYFGADKTDNPFKKALKKITNQEIKTSTKDKVKSLIGNKKYLPQKEAQEYFFDSSRSPIGQTLKNAAIKEPSRQVGNRESKKALERAYEQKIQKELLNMRRKGASEEWINERYKQLREEYGLDFNG